MGERGFSVRDKLRHPQIGRSSTEPRKTGRAYPRGSCPIRVLTAHGHDLVRLGVRAMLDGEDDIVIEGESRSLAGALSQFPRIKPDVVLIEPHFSGRSHGKQSRLPSNADHGMRLVVMPMPRSFSAAHHVADVGMCGYELKDMSRVELLRAIRLTAKRVPEASLETIDRTAAQQRKAVDELRESKLHLLSSQERRLMPLVADGKTNREIAMELALSPKTVKNYLANMFKKLQITRRAQAAALYTRALKLYGRRSVFHGGSKDPCRAY
jgi:two-component system response regulator DevR